jgi:6-pyruvoyl-tetrahydropterin synthase
MFEVGLVVTFRALHRMPSQPPPEDELHPHDYRVEAVAQRQRLDDRSMVCDLEVLKERLGHVADGARDRDLAGVCGTDVVTVEVLAAWTHAQLADAVRNDGAEYLAVRVWESDDAFGGVRDRV